MGFDGVYFLYQHEKQCDLHRIQNHCLEDLKLSCIFIDIYITNMSIQLFNISVV